MKITPHQNSNRPAPKKAPENPKNNNDLTIKDVVTKGAFTAGGALGGTGLGVATGLALSNISGNPVFGQFGGIAGALGGAAIGFSASHKGVSKENLARSVGSWVGASVLSSAGMWGVGSASAALATYGASAVLGANGALIGAVAGGLVGAAVPLAGSKGKVSNVLINSANVAAGGTAGVLAGAGIQAMALEPFVRGLKEGEELATNVALEQLKHTMPQYSAMLAPIPVLTAAVGALSLADIRYNHDYTVTKPNLRKARNTSLAVGAGYVGGAVAGGIAHGILQGSANYLVAAPVVGAAAAGLACLGAHHENQNDNAYYKASKTVLLTGVGASLGDAIGHGLSALTGHSIYRNIGTAAGAVNGLTAGLRWSGIDDKKGLPVVTGLLSGGASGAMLGAGVSALSGQGVWKVAMPVLGAATGALTGLALSMQKDS